MAAHLFPASRTHLQKLSLSFVEGYLQNLFCGRQVSLEVQCTHAVYELDTVYFGRQAPTIKLTCSIYAKGYEGYR